VTQRGHRGNVVLERETRDFSGKPRFVIGGDDSPRQ
jgi:hypothetical protein